MKKSNQFLLEEESDDLRQETVYEEINQILDDMKMKMLSTTIMMMILITAMVEKKKMI